MEFKNIKSEEDAIEWIGFNIPILIKPIRKASTTYVDSFKSQNALNVVVETLGVKLFKELEKVNYGKDYRKKS